MSLFGNSSPKHSVSSNPAANALQVIKSALDENDLKYRDVSNENFQAIRLGFGLENMSSGEVFIIFDDDGESYRIRSGVIMSVADSKRAKMLETINKVNNDYRWARFFIDGDGDLMIQEDVDFLVPDKHLAMISILRFVQIMDDAYPEFMRAQWA